jgi:hypothetical protein
MMSKHIRMLNPIDGLLSLSIAKQETNLTPLLMLAIPAYTLCATVRDQADVTTTIYPSVINLL